MRGAVTGALLVGGLIGLACGMLAKPERRAHAQSAAVTGRDDGTGLLAFSTKVRDAYEQLTVIDPQLRSMSVYHIGLANGEIALKSVRALRWDLQLDAWNSDSPLPHEIQSMLRNPQ